MSQYSFAWKKYLNVQNLYCMFTCVVAASQLKKKAIRFNYGDKVARRRLGQFFYILINYQQIFTLHQVLRRMIKSKK